MFIEGIDDDVPQSTTNLGDQTIYRADSTVTEIG
jgi:hypothetical protein